MSEQLTNVSLHLGSASAVRSRYAMDGKEPYATISVGALGTEVTIFFRVQDREKLREFGTEALRLSFELDRDAAQKEADERAAREAAQVPEAAPLSPPAWDAPF